MTDIMDIEGIGQAYGAKLKAVGIGVDTELIEAAGSRKGREDLASATGISVHVLLEWVNRTDLARVEGVGSRYAVLLEAAGVDSAPELATRDAANLALKLEQVNDLKHLVQRTPSVTETRAWIAHAATLPRVVTY